MPDVFAQTRRAPIISAAARNNHRRRGDPVAARAGPAYAGGVAAVRTPRTRDPASGGAWTPARRKGPRACSSASITISTPSRAAASPPSRCWPLSA
jgi:hypothetical protein